MRTWATGTVRLDRLTTMCAALGGASEGRAPGHSAPAIAVVSLIGVGDNDAAARGGAAVAGRGRLGSDRLGRVRGRASGGSGEGHAWVPAGGRAGWRWFMRSHRCDHGRLRPDRRPGGWRAPATLELGKSVENTRRMS